MLLSTSLEAKKTLKKEKEVLVTRRRFPVYQQHSLSSATSGSIGVTQSPQQTNEQTHAEIVRPTHTHTHILFPFHFIFGFIYNKTTTQKLSIKHNNNEMKTDIYGLK
eukprot:m.75025 g.75025  ORF g.75025 m.75025 type:complete len:107 (+) comp11831_c0_seq1:1053-1373(+)